LNLSYFIARRYLFSKQKANFINIISILSMSAVAFVTAALIIVLSVFNGIGDLLHSLNNAFDPEIKVQASAGKSFETSEAWLGQIRKVEGVKIITEVIEDYAYVKYGEASQFIILKGVSDSFLDQNRIPPEAIVEGELKLKDGNINYAILGKGVQYTLSVAVREPLYPLQVYYIRNAKSSTDVSKLYAKKNIIPGAVFSIVQTFDENYVIVPLDFARDLLLYGNKRTALEIKIDDNADVFEVEQQLQNLLGTSFNVLNHEEQHQDLYKLLKMEKLFTFLALTLLLLIGSINIFFSLMMLALDKKKDISILSAMGADAKQIRNIFIAEGGLIAFLGACTGLALGGIFCWIQLKFGIISMGMETSVTQGYPIQVKATDFFYTLSVVTLVTFAISAYPARLAARFATVKHL
jgi:lipoprotein-releasing system permease protein